MKKALQRGALVCVIVTILLVSTACAKKAEVKEKTSSISTVEEAIMVDQKLVDDINENRQAIEILDNGQTLFSFDFSDKNIEKVEITLAKSIKENFLDVQIYGALVPNASHNLKASIINGKAEFDVNYIDKTVHVIVNNA